MFNDPQNDALRVVLPPRRRIPSQDVSLETPSQDLKDSSSKELPEDQTAEDAQPVATLPAKSSVLPRLAYKSQGGVEDASLSRRGPLISSEFGSSVSSTCSAGLVEEPAGLLEKRASGTLASFSSPSEEDLFSFSREGMRTTTKANEFTSWAIYIALVVSLIALGVQVWILLEK